jgi:tetratricopeptide (TPR) repeat protein
LRKARRERGFTQGELAAPDYSAAYVSVIEAGKRQPSEQALKHFAKRLRMTYEELATGRPPDAEPTLEQELAAARLELSSGNRDGAMNAFRRVAKRAAKFELEGLRERAQLGEAFCLEGSNPARAAEFYETLLERIPDDHSVTKADAVAGRARCLRTLGDVPYAIYVLESYLSHLTRNRLLVPEALMRIHITLMGVYFEYGLMKQAQAAADEALSLSARVDDREKLAGMHLNLARVLLERGDFEGATRSFAVAEKMYGELGFQAEIGRAHLARAFLTRKQGRRQETRLNLEAALKIFEATGNRVNLARALSELGALDRQEGHVDQAIFQLTRAAREAANQEPASAAISHRELALCYVEKGDHAKVRSNFKKAIALLEESGDNYELAITYRCWGDALREEKDYEQACDLYRSAAVALEAA